MSARTYAIVTPARNEAANLPRLARVLAAQTHRPAAWLIVDNGSDDGTAEVAAGLAAATPWISMQSAPGGEGIVRGGPIARAFQAGLAALDGSFDVVIKVDADISMEPDYFARLLGAFAEDDRLGIASGSAWERDGDGVWRQQFSTGGSVWGACRAYRWECLQDILPLDEQMGWDGIDRLKANARGWRTVTLLDLRFDHHRREGERDGSRRRAWAAQGDCAWYMGYRPYYVGLRGLHHALRDPAALALITAYAKAALRRNPRCEDPEVRAYLREEQGLRNLLQRRREALGRAAPSASA